MDAMKAILTQKSICQYTKEPIPDSILKALMEAAPPCYILLIDPRRLSR